MQTGILELFLFHGDHGAGLCHLPDEACVPASQEHGGAWGHFQAGKEAAMHTHTALSSSPGLASPKYGLTFYFPVKSEWEANYTGYSHPHLAALVEWS